MTSTFVPNDVNRVRTALCDGFKFNSISSRDGIIAKGLSKLGLITIQSRRYVLCSCPEDNDFPPINPECPGKIYLNSEELNGEIFCQICERDIDPDEKNRIFNEYFIRLDASGIFNYIRRRIDETGYTSNPIINGWTEFQVDGKTCVLCIPSNCLNARYLSYHYVYSNPILYVYLPHRIPNQKSRPPLKYILLEDLICNSETWLCTRIDEALAIDSKLPSAIELENKFHNFINKISDTDFEKFASFLVNKAAKQNSKIREFERLLKRDRHNVHGQFAVHVGGSGHSDGFLFKKRDYLSGLFDGKWQHIETKRYVSSNSVLNDDKFKTFHSNCMTEEQDGAIFLANNEVTGDVWNKVKSFYDRFGYAKYAVLPKDLLLELIVVLGGDIILEEFLAQINGFEN